MRSDLRWTTNHLTENRNHDDRHLFTLDEGVTTMGRLADKNILITGGNSGIGLATAQEFDREGARVAICGFNESTLQAAKGALGGRKLLRRACVSQTSHP